MKKKLLLFLLLASFSKIQAQWNLFWSDEFNGSTVNTANWTYDTGGGGWGNSELENYTNRTVNATVSGGNLLIIGKKESYGGSSYTSARLKTQGLQNWTYGKIEARMKLPMGKGLWPAFWMLGQNISTVGWPKCGEIDIMEHINTENLIYGTMHWDNAGHASYGKNTPCDVTKYHVYSVEWDADSIKWFLDGTTKYVVGNIYNNINSTDEFHAPFFILLNMAIGGSWPGNPDVTTPFPDTMFVDYVRVYQKTTTSIKNSNALNTLLECFPNPFDENTTINYSISKDARVELAIFDLLGNKVETIESAGKSAGNYSSMWNAKNVSQGIYLLQLKVDFQIFTKKIIVTQ